MKQLIHESAHGRGSPGLYATFHARSLLRAIVTCAPEIFVAGYPSAEFVIRQHTIFWVYNDGATIFTIYYGQNRRAESVNIRICISRIARSNRLCESSSLFT
jgi:hypothetical protein